MATVEQPQAPTSWDAIFAGGNAILQFTDPNYGYASPTLWWADANTKKLTPFQSEAAFTNFFQNRFGFPVTVADAFRYNSINIVPVAALGSGTLKGFTLLKDEEGVGEDGIIKSMSADVNPNNIYGKTKDADTFSSLGVHPLDGILSGMVQAAGVDQSFVDKIKKDPAMTAFYANAMAYGGYAPSDIIRDVKRKFLISQGETSLSGTTVIHSTQDKNAFVNSTGGTDAENNPLLSLPRSINGIPTYITGNENSLALPVSQLHPDVWKILVPPLDFSTEEGKAAMDKIKTAYYDIMRMQISADSEREKAAADQAYSFFRQQLEQNFNIKLSDNAFTAWDQITGIMDAAASGGLAGTGMETEKIQDLLATVRRKDQQQRDATTSSAEDAKFKYYTTSASSKQIKDDLSSGKVTMAELQKWGMVPSEEQKKLFTYDALKAAYPTLTDDEIKDWQAYLIDENGLFRSGLYQNLYQNLYENKRNKQDTQQFVAQEQNKEQERIAREAALGKIPDEIKADATKDTSLMKKYGLVNGTVYNKETGVAYKDLPSFLKDETGSATGSFSDWDKLDTNYVPTTAKPAGTVPIPATPTPGTVREDDKVWNGSAWVVQGTYMGGDSTAKPALGPGTNVTYDQLYRKGNSIFNKSGYEYHNPIELHTALGKNVGETGQIDWQNSNIAKPQVSTSTPTYTNSPNTSTNSGPVYTPPPTGTYTATTFEVPKPTAPVTQNSLSDKYGLYNGTVYNKFTNTGYISQAEFFGTKGLNIGENASFSDWDKLDKNYKPPGI